MYSNSDILACFDSGSERNTTDSVPVFTCIAQLTRALIIIMNMSVCVCVCVRACMCVYLRSYTSDQRRYENKPD